MPGPFFTLDGLDGTGKSTQCRLLADVLRGRGLEVVTCADPGGTQIGAELRALLLQSKHALDMTCEALLFMASRAQLVADVIRPALAAGKAVVSDRFLLANVVYQGHAGGLDVETLWTVGNLATGGLTPDRTFLLDVPLEMTMRRRKPKPDRLESRGESFFAKVRMGFLTEAARRAEIRVIDATASIEEIHADIVRKVDEYLGKGP